MAYTKGYIFRVGGDPAPKVVSGKLDEGILSRLGHRKWKWKLRLVHSRHGKVITKGPWRKGPWGVVSDTFANTIRQDGKVGDQFVVMGRFRRIFSVSVDELTKGELVIEAGKTEIGTHYIFGAANGPEDYGADAFDCSGFTQWAWATVGESLIHSAEAQRQQMIANHSWHSGSSLAGAQPGDLVFMWFPNSRGIPSYHASHVGLFYQHAQSGGGKTIPDLVLDTRNPVNEPVGIRSAAGVIGYGRPG